MRDVFVEREIECATGDGLKKGYIQIFKPVQDQDDWRCDYSLKWADYEKSFYAMGVDSFQSLQLALYIVPTVVSISQDFKDGRLQFLGEPLTNENLRDAFEIKWPGELS
ncbi:MAG: hypothetical protein GYB49_08380 [Alphaproteobacteria bacterium]|nr:hypothetical protein [Hyphomonas sp.]MBR9807222.1 hypothetical protein [Alphaproteobacteria bacterium]|tara:strand:- start:212 stop:538 length:327 start_codon:yes stop_codon:yes gene_type:complete